MNWWYHKPKFEYEDKFDDSAWPWVGHRYFAYDLMANIRPKVIVELGTHYGTSLWSFSQAVKDLNIDTELNAVDTWQGEKHAGFYGEEVFQTVNQIKDKYYKNVKINLIRKTFDEALPDFEDGSIDILHIDGLHTYDAVKHDFENWLPKLCKGGIVLLHDIKVQENDFGVYRLWEELKEKNVTIEFFQSYGLGVLFLDKVLGKEVKNKEKELQMHYLYIHEAIKSQSINNKTQTVVSKNLISENLNKTIELKDFEIQAGNQIIKTKDKEILSKQNELDSIKSQLDTTKSQFDLKVNELSAIYACRGWRMIVFLRKVLKIIVPDGTFRRRVARLFFRVFRKIYRSPNKVKKVVLYFKKILKKSIVIIKSDGTLFFLKKVLKRLIYRETHHDFSNRKVTLNTQTLKFVYYISNVAAGGANKYILDLINSFEKPYLNFVRIKNREDLNFYKNYIKAEDVLLFQYLFDTDITFDDIVDIKKKYGIKLVIPTHDFYFLRNNKANFHQCDADVHFNYVKKEPFSSSVMNLLTSADLIIYPSKFVKSVFDSIFVFNNAQVSRHIDYKIIDYIKIPAVKKTINIGIINDIRDHKGASCYPELFKNNEYQNYSIVFHIFGNVEINSPNVIFHGPYAEGEIFDLLNKNNIHGLAFLNEFAETYSYSLTKGINSGLPILYSNIGVYIERLQDNKKFFPVNNIKDIKWDMEKMLNFVLKNNGINLNYNAIQTEADIPDLYRELFSIDYNSVLNRKFKGNKKLYSELFTSVEPYAIYFPQFHALEENKKTFYDGYHDMINLQQAKVVDLSIETPINDYLGYYNLKNDDGIIEKQILTARAYGLKGFGIYYYWFSHNTVSGNNMLMKEVVDKFFEKEIRDFDVFFIYANESWSGNPAFNQNANDYIITNEYSKKEIAKNFENLLKYFKHVNYKKIDKKPVFFIHHPWEMTVEELDLFYSIGDELMKANGFDGLELVVNAMKGGYEDYKNYSHHADYKNASSFTTIENGIRYIDYKKYVDDYLPTVPFNSRNMQTIFYNFDNTVRYHNHKNKQILITKTKNNNVELFKKFLNFQLNTYNSTDKVGKILLINSWNEWGEQMAIEPSNEYGFKLLNVFTETVLEFVKKNKNLGMFYNYPLVSGVKNGPNLYVNERKENEICVILHLYHTDMLDEMLERLKNIPYGYTLIVSLVESKFDTSIIEKIKEYKSDVKIIIFENKGMDILPFLRCLKYVPLTTKYLLKIHTKKSLYEPEIGVRWFKELMDHVLLDKNKVNLVLGTLENTNIGMVGGSKVSGFEYSGIFTSDEFYEPKIEEIYNYFNVSHSEYKWISGSIFWVRFDLINKFDDKFIGFVEENQPVGYYKDGTLAHGLERYFGKLVYDAGKIISLNPIKIKE